MRRIVMMLAAMGLGLSASAYANTELAGDLPKVDRFEAVKSAELKGGPCPHPRKLLDRRLLLPASSASRPAQLRAEQ
jgi:hypothetical protein